MFKGLKQRLDQWVIRLATNALPAPCPRPGQVAEASAILADPEFFHFPELAADLVLQSSRQFSFDSRLPLPWSATNRASGWFYKTEGDWRAQPLMVLLHGWDAEIQFRHQFPRVCRRFARQGLNAAALQLPFHGLRRPMSGPIQDFISDDLPAMLQATRQSLSDIHALVLWAKREGLPGVGLWGFSLGAWLAGLYVSSTSAATLAVLTTPIVDLGRAVEELPFCGPIRAALDGERLDLAPLNLAARAPCIPSNRILLHQADYDVFVPSATLQRLAQNWNCPDYRTLPHGHISILLSPALFRDTVSWCRRTFVSARVAN